MDGGNSEETHRWVGVAQRRHTGGWGQGGSGEMQQVGGAGVVTVVGSEHH